MNLHNQKSKLESSSFSFELTGEILTIKDSEEISNEFTQHTSKNQSFFIFNLKGLDYKKSKGLNFIITYFINVRNTGDKLLVCELSERVKDLLVITKLNTTIITSFNTLNEALQNFKIKTINN
jgi:anti-anti-sigma factor